MATENKTYLLKVELDTTGLVKTAEDASVKLTELKTRQKELKGAGAENSVEYAKLREEIKQTTKTLNDSSGAILIAEQQDKNKTQTMRDLAQVQKVLAVQFNNLTDEEIKSTDAGKKIAQQYKEVNDTLNKNSQSVGDGRRNVGLYKQAILEANKEIGSLKKEVTQIGFAYGQTQTKIEDSTKALANMSAETDPQAYAQLSDEIKELNKDLEFQEMALAGANEELAKQEQALAETEKEARKIGFVYGENVTSVRDLSTELKEMQNVMASTDANSEEYIQASARAGELRDKLKEVKENTNAMAGGSGFEKMSNSLSGLKGDLMNLDFEGVSEKAKTLQSISQNMTFKEVTGGLKSMGSTLISLGKTILANPLFLMVAVIAAVVGALIAFASETETAEAESEAFTASLERQNGVMDRQAEILNRNAKFLVDKAKAQKKSNEEIAELEKEALKTEFYTQELKLKANKEAIKEAKFLLQNAIQEENEEVKKKYYDQIKSLQKNNADIANNRGALSQQLQLIDIETENQQKEKREKELSETKEKNTKLYEDAKKRKEDNIKLAQEVADRIRELQQASIQLTNDNEKTLIENQTAFKLQVAELTIHDEEKKALAIIEIQKQKFAELEAVEIKERELEIQRLKDNEKKLLSESKGSKEQIAIQNVEIQKQTQLQIDAINESAKNQKIENDAEILKLEKDLNQARLDNFNEANTEKLTNLEADLQAEINLLKSQGKKEEEILKATALKEIEIEKQRNKIVQDDKNKSDAEKRLSEEQTNAQILEINKRSNEIELEEEKKTADEKKAINEAIVNAIQSITATAFQLSQNQIQEDLNNTKLANEQKQTELQNQLDSGLISQAQFNEKKKELDIKLKREESALNQKAFEQKRLASLIEAGINTGVAVTKALASAPPPASFILAGIAGTLGAVQVASILAAPTPKFKKGGVFGGNSHENGGTKGYFSDGTQIEVEKDEAFFILNKNATPKINQLSNLNVATGGVPLFASGGGMSFSVTGASAESKVLDNLNTASLIVDAFKMLPNPIVLVDDINTGQTNKSIVVDSGVI